MNLGEKHDKKKDKMKKRFVLRCSVCFSDRSDLWLGGKGGLQMRKCLDCGYIGPVFVEVEQEWTPPTGEKKT